MYDRPIMLTEFAPDLPPTTPGILLDSNNLEPTAKGLRVMADFEVIQTAALPTSGVSFGAFTAELSDGTYETFVAASHPLFHVIYRYDATAQAFVAFSLQFATATRYRYATFGLHVIAVNGVSPPLIWRKGIDTEFAVLSDAGVSDLPPDFIASTVCVVDEGIFLVKAGTDQWRFSLSDLLWTPSIATATVASGDPGLLGPSGPITAAMPCRGGIAFFKDGSLHLGRFTGPPFFWAFDAVSKTVGCQWQEAIVNTGDVLLFPGPDEFYSFDGSSLTPVPNNLREWFFRRFNALQSDFSLSNAFPTIIGRYDAHNGIAIWHYATPADPEGMLSEWVAYNTQTNRWTKGARHITDVILPFFPQRDSAGHVVRRIPAIFDMDHVLNTLGVSPAPSFLLTGEYGDGASFIQVNRIRPVFADYPSDRSAHLQAFQRNIFGYPYPDLSQLPIDVKGPEAWLEPDGAFNFIQSARSHQFRIDMTGQAEITALIGDFVADGEE